MTNLFLYRYVEYIYTHVYLYIVMTSQLTDEKIYRETAATMPTHEHSETEPSPTHSENGTGNFFLFF